MYNLSEIPFIPTCCFCITGAELEPLERDENGEVTAWICPECGEVDYDPFDSGEQWE